MKKALEVRGLTKTFPGVTALDRVSFDLAAGEVHALCGENGAGKSTLIKVLSGIHPHGSYEGEILVDGRPAAFASIADAEDVGIAVIYQELALVAMDPLEPAAGAELLRGFRLGHGLLALLCATALALIYTAPAGKAKAA